jgi:hypothetical protein
MAFNKKDFPNSEQPPRVEGCEPWEIWNWEDLAKLKYFTEAPAGKAQFENDYGNRAVVMQNIGVTLGVDADDAKTNPACPYFGTIKAEGNYGYNLPHTFGTFTAGFHATEGWMPIGISTGVYQFAGRVDGQEHAITGLWINRPGSGNNFQGLFGLIGYSNSATIENLGINILTSVTGYDIVGALAGSIHNSKVSNCYATGMVNGNERVGVLLGSITAVKITNCYATGTVNSTSGIVGGLIGANYDSEVINCYSTADVTGSASSSYGFGGLVASLSGSESKIINCYATGSVSGYDWVGGLLGRSFGGEITNSYATGAVTGNENVGGLLGDNFFMKTTNSYATGVVTGNKNVGGLVGGAGYYSVIIHCFAFNPTIIVPATATFVGRVLGNISGTTLTNNYALETMKLIGIPSFTVPTNSGSNENGADIDGCEEATRAWRYLIAPEPWDFDGTWTFDYAAHNVKVAAGVNLPVLMVFNEDDFPKSEQPPKVGGCNPWEIWNWKDLAKLKYFTEDPAGQIEFAGDYGSKAIVMQNIGITVGVDADDAFDNPACPWKGTPAAYGNYGYDQPHTFGTFTAGFDATEGWMPIGIGTVGKRFIGHVDGQGFAISGLWIDRLDSNQGLFGITEGVTTIENLGINIHSTKLVTGGSWTGALAGQIYKTTISNCYVIGTVIGKGSIGAGGLIGYASEPNISNCYVIGTVTGNNWVGGLIGFAYEGGSITNCSATCDVSGSYEVGGLLGAADGIKITNCSSSCTVTGTNNIIGGLTGEVYGGGSITNCSASGTVSGNKDVGGLVGYTDGKITNSSSSCTVTGTSFFVGGLVGEAEGEISNSFATGDVTGEIDDVGGLVGSTWKATITNCYATGAVKGKEEIGGLAG